jgi:hypothetical protein
MKYLVSLDHNDMAAHLTRSDCGVFLEMQWMGLMMICCGMTVKRMGMLGVSVRKMKALTVKMETVTLIGKGIRNLTHFVH